MRLKNLYKEAAENRLDVRENKQQSSEQPDMLKGRPPNACENTRGTTVETAGDEHRNEIQHPCQKNILIIYIVIKQNAYSHDFFMK